MARHHSDTSPLSIYQAAITAEQILEVGEFYGVKDLRSLQRNMTATVRLLHQLTGGRGLTSRIGNLLSLEQQELLRNATTLLDSINYRITHAKECRQRSDKQAEARRKQRADQAHRMVNGAYPLPLETPEQQLEVIKLALVLNRAGHYQSFFSEIQLNERLRGFPKVQLAAARNGDPGVDLTLRLRTRLDFERVEIQAALTTHLEDDTGGLTVQARFDALQQRLAELAPQVLESRLASETLRIWTEALSKAEQREGRT